jgi:hypothetical protein
MPGAMRATEYLAAGFDAMANDFAFAVSAFRREGMDRAFEAVEYIHRAVPMNLKALVVVIAAHLTLGHSLDLLASLWSQAIPLVFRGY